MEIEINWERVRQESFTGIRKDFPVETLIELNRHGNYTPVSGDRLACEKRVGEVEDDDDCWCGEGRSSPYCTCTSLW